MGSIGVIILRGMRKVPTVDFDGEIDGAQSFRVMYIPTFMQLIKGMNPSDETSFLTLLASHMICSSKILKDHLYLEIPDAVVDCAIEKTSMRKVGVFQLFRNHL